MLFIWLVVWLLSSSPPVTFEPMNDWGLALIICGVLSFMTWVYRLVHHNSDEDEWDDW